MIGNVTLTSSARPNGTHVTTHAQTGRYLFIYLFIYLLKALLFIEGFKALFIEAQSTAQGDRPQGFSQVQIFV